MITVLLIDQSACFSLSLPAYIFWFAASRALPSMFAIWQAMQICNSLHSSHSTFHILLTSRAVSGWMVHNLASSVPIRTCALFCTSSLGTHPKPRDRTLCELRVLQNAEVSFFLKYEINDVIKTTITECCVYFISSFFGTYS